MTGSIAVTRPLAGRCNGQEIQRPSGSISIRFAPCKSRIAFGNLARPRNNIV